MTDPSRYPAQVFWSDDDKGFIAIAPDLPGCSAFGDTQSQALAELQLAIDAWIQAARAANNPIPEPSDPAVRLQYSGKVLVRMPRALHARLTSEAKAEEVSLNQYIVSLLSTASACSSTRERQHSHQPHRLIGSIVALSGVLFTTYAVQASEVRPIYIDVSEELTAVTTGRLEAQYG